MLKLNHSYSFSINNSCVTLVGKNQLRENPHPNTETKFSLTVLFLYCTFISLSIVPVLDHMHETWSPNITAVNSPNRMQQKIEATPGWIYGRDTYLEWSYQLMWMEDRNLFSWGQDRPKLWSPLGLKHRMTRDTRRDKIGERISNCKILHSCLPMDSGGPFLLRILFQLHQFTYLSQVEQWCECGGLRELHFLHLWENTLSIYLLALSDILNFSSSTTSWVCSPALSVSPTFVLFFTPSPF